MAGRLLRVLVPEASMVAGITARAEFLRPPMETSPNNGLLPRTISSAKVCSLPTSVMVFASLYFPYSTPDSVLHPEQNWRKDRFLAVSHRQTIIRP